MTACLPDVTAGIVREPDCVHRLQQLVWRLYCLGRDRESLTWGKRLLAVDPGHVQALSITGHILSQLKRFPPAIAVARHCLALAPEDERAWLSLAFALLSSPRIPADPAPALHAATLRPDDRTALNNLGFALTTLKRFDEAKTWLRQALTGEPDHPALLMNLACVFCAEGEMEPAAALCRRVLATRPDDVGAMTNQGTYRLNQGRSQDAIALYRRATTLAPGQADAHHYAAMAHLRLGAFAIGWDLYEWRWRNEPGLNFPQLTRGRPGWDGGDITGKTVLLHSEQGLGDTLQFCRYVPLVAEKAKVLLAVPAPLRGLMASLRGDIRVLRDGEPLPPFDLHCPLMSLARLFRTTADTIPETGAYLRADTRRSTVWRQRLGRRGLRIGLAWSGNPGHSGDGRRSLPLGRLLPLIWNSGADWHVVQKDLRDEDRALVAATPRLTWHGGDLADFDDTAALVGALDLVIAVDTSVAHLAGALGLPTWLMLPYACDWRWMEERDDSPWYASIRLFRQTRPGDWDGVITRIAENLAVFSRPPAPHGNWDSAAARQARA